MADSFVVTASALNVRTAPDITATVLGLLRNSEVVKSSEISPDQQWLKVSNGSLEGWSAARYLRHVDTAAPSNTLNKILQIANNSAIATYDWSDRGIAPRGYTKGMAVVFAKVYSRLLAGDIFATAMAKAVTSSTDDVLQHYASTFSHNGMDNDSSGGGTLRHLFALMMGLGMRESSGEWFTGRDRSARNVSSNTAEAGLFQSSWNLHESSPLMEQLVDQYKAGSREGYLSIFNSPPLTPNSADLKNFGSGDGAEFQRLSKEMPALSVEVAALGSRFNRKHWGPLNNRAAELRSEASTMLLKVQQVVDQEGAPF